MRAAAVTTCGGTAVEGVDGSGGGDGGTVRGAWTRNHCKRVELYGDRDEWE